jgi:PAS domain S-box-containing protein
MINRLRQYHPERATRGLSGASALVRMRWVFLAMIFLSNLSQIPIAVSIQSGLVFAGPIAAAAIIWLVLSAMWVERQGRPHPALDVADCCALLIVGLSATSSIVVSTMFPIVFFTSTYGSTRRVALRTAGFLAAFLGAMALAQDLDARTLPVYVISMLAVASVMHLLTASFQRNERSLVYQRTLASAGARFVAARKRDEVYDAALDSAHELHANDPWIGATFLLPSEQELLVVGARGPYAAMLLGTRFPGFGAGTPATSVRGVTHIAPFTEVLIVPLVLAGELLGAIGLASRSAIRNDTEGAVLALAAETVLSLEVLSADERFRSLVQHSNDVFTIVAPDGRISYQSPSYSRLTGLSSERTVGEPIARLLHLQDAAELSRQLSAGSISTIQLQLRWSHADGSWRQTEAIISNLCADPNIKGWIFNTRDVSERARLEIELRQAQKLESIGRLAAGMAHEINTPLQFVGDNLRFLKNSIADMMRSTAATGGLPAADVDVVLLAREIPLAIDESLEGVLRVASIVRSMLDFAHPTGREQASADLNQALLSTLAVARGELQSVAVVTTDLGDLPPVQCYLGELNQMFLNLIVNAAHAVADGDPGRQGAVEIRSWRDGQEVVISVEDNGCGIPENIRTQVFDPFFTTKQVGRGSGQGLAVARSIIVDKHGGSIDFISVVGQGTTFVVRLPIAGPASASARIAA